MASDHVKSAFAARLKKLSSDKQLGAKQADLPGSSIAGGVATVAGAVAPAPGVARTGIRLEGWLEKQSSGTVRRWQRRFFILDGVAGTLGYYKTVVRAEDAGKTKASRSFPLRLAVSVTLAVDGTGREFWIVFGNGKVYKLSGESRGDSVKWVGALESVLAVLRSQNLNSSFDAADFRSEDFDELESVASSSFSRTDLASSSGGNQRQSSSLVPATLWELDTDLLDRSFANWFHFVDSSACSDAQVLAATQLVIEDITRHQLVGVRDTGQIRTVANEYVSRLESFLAPLLAHFDQVQSSVHLLCLLVSLRAALFSVETLALAAGPPSTGLAKRKPRDAEPWKRQLQELIDRLASDYEVWLIERIREGMQNESVWEETVNLQAMNHAKLKQATGGPHGPSLQHLEGVYAEKPVFVSSWFPTFASIIAKVEVEGRLVRQKHKEASTFIAEVVAASLVAAFNHAWRKFHRRAARANTKRISDSRSSLWSESSSSLWTRLVRIVRESPGTEAPPVNLRWENGLSFANECELMAHVLNSTLRADPEYPEVYSLCMDSLGKCFGNLRDETVRTLVEDALLKNSATTSQVFRRRRIVKEATYSPMRGILGVVKNFLGLAEVAAHESVRLKIVAHTMRVTLLMYLTGLVKSDIVLAKTPNLPQTMLQDELVFAEFFTKNYTRIVHDQIKSTCEPLTRMRTLLAAPISVAALRSLVAPLTRAFSQDPAREIMLGLFDVVETKKDDRALVLAEFASNCS